MDGKVVDSHAMPRSLPVGIGWVETFNVGVNTGTSVDDQDYQVLFRFTGKISKLTVKLGPEETNAGGKGDDLRDVPRKTIGAELVREPRGPLRESCPERKRVSKRCSVIGSQ